MSGDMTDTIIAKSDQLNADDLIGRELTIKITKATVKKGSDQPVILNYEGDNGKPYKPSKGMRRVMVLVWGDESQSYVGKSMTLYRDETVKWGGAAVGGIRISHMSHITVPQNMSVTVSRGVKSPHTVHPLKIQQTAKPASETDPMAEIRRDATEIQAKLKEAPTAKDAEFYWNSQSAKIEKIKAASQSAYDHLVSKLKERTEVITQTIPESPAPADSLFPGDMPSPPESTSAPASSCATCGGGDSGCPDCGGK